MIRLSERARPLPWKTDGGLVGDPKLLFRRAMPEEAATLKQLYEDAWGCGITIDERQIRSKIERFPEGQIVGCDPGSGRPVSMINIMLTGYRAESGFRGGYEDVTGGRTFSTHVPFPELEERIGPDGLPVALCASIAVLRSFGNNGFALETLGEAISFAEENGAYAVPYSAPRGFSRALGADPGLDLDTYLHMTVPSREGYDAHVARIQRLNRMGRVKRAFGRDHRTGLIRETTGSMFDEYQALGTDGPGMRRRYLAFFKFLERDADSFMDAYGRYPLIEDFCLLTGRKLLDPVMRMHVDNGARFIRDRHANITAAFKDSRPEDTAAAGYNVLLTYGYHPAFGQPYVADLQRT